MAAALAAGAEFPKMLSLEQVKEILNVTSSLVYALVRSGELRAAQFGGRGIWRVREDDLVAYIEGAFEATAERIAAGQIPEGDEAEN
ncbi:MAG: DNA-binding protein excisionase family [Arthrobacter sp.]|nr:DNA-binding protein excisionase family [Arthrobacter sp.]